LRSLSDRRRLHRLRPARRPQKLHPGRITLIGCSKLDERKSFVDKLTAILAAHDVEGIAVLEMEVPCCSNLEAFARQALKMAGKEVPVMSVVLGIDGGGAGVRSAL
jgi:hypothetical protein